MNNKVSIITPSYNSKNFIEATITSVINQTYENWDLNFKGIGYTKQGKKNIL